MRRLSFFYLKLESVFTCFIKNTSLTRVKEINPRRVFLNKRLGSTSVLIGCFLALVTFLVAFFFTQVDLFGEGSTVCKGFAFTVSSFSLEVVFTSPTIRKVN
jgi:hypothetical protein